MYDKPCEGLVVEKKKKSPPLSPPPQALKEQNMEKENIDILKDKADSFEFFFFSS